MLAARFKGETLDLAERLLVIYEADRMNLSAANIFLKTLEEPTASTTILLLTTRPYSLLPTIRSRCQRVRFAGGLGTLVDADRPVNRHGTPPALLDCE